MKHSSVLVAVVDEVELHTRITIEKLRQEAKLATAKAERLRLAGRTTEAARWLKFADNWLKWSDGIAGELPKEDSNESLPRPRPPK